MYLLPFSYKHDLKFGLEKKDIEKSFHKNLSGIENFLSSKEPLANDKKLLDNFSSQREGELFYYLKCPYYEEIFEEVS